MSTPKRQYTKRKSSELSPSPGAKKQKLLANVKTERDDDNTAEPTKTETSVRVLRKRAIRTVVKHFSSDEDEEPTPKPKSTRGRPATKIKKEVDDDYNPTEAEKKVKPRITRARKVAVKKEKDAPSVDMKPEYLNDINIKQEKISGTEINIKIEPGDSTDGAAKSKPETTTTANIKTEKIGNNVSTEISASKKVKKEDRPLQCASKPKYESLWIDYQLLADMQNLELHYARQIVKLFEEGNTIPFIARYRRDATGNLGPEELREVKDAYEKINQLKEKQQTVIKVIEKAGKLKPDLQRSILCSRTFDEVEHIYAPFKPGAKRSLAERAKAAGLEEAAMTILQNKAPVNLKEFIVADNKDLQNLEEVQKGIMHIIAHVLATDTDLLNELRKERNFIPAQVETKQIITRKETKAKVHVKNEKHVDELKFENYFDFRQSTRNIRPYQVLAINRGESLKVLSVKIHVPFELQKKFVYHCNKKWLQSYGTSSSERSYILEKAIEDAYNRLVQPLIIREIRSDLKAKAEKAACDVFSNNTKQLLLGAPLKGCPILAIDPGYSNGCKLALISPTGSLVAYNVIYPHTSSKNTYKDEMILKKMILNNNCETIALGNGTACRETEAWLTDLINNRVFAPLDVKYTIVSENGASIYSCSAEAKKEFPDLDPNIISAISLARRIQDPLAELVKIEPKHLGVGMYQHDIPKKQLEDALNEVVSECVSFTGVDLNTASQCILRRIAGLTDKRATGIIEHRDKKGPFMSRKDLMDVKGIGPKVFEQCAGFLRVGPFSKEEETMFYRHPKANRLDRTDIHPESYDLAMKIIKMCNLNVRDIGEHAFSSIILRWRTEDIKGVSGKLNQPEQTISLIFDALSKPLNYDFRIEISKTPLFKKGLTSINDLSVGSVLTGCVRNVCDFGCFIDIGVGNDGLIHNSKLNGFVLQIGDTAEVEVINLDIPRKRIGLLALRKL